MGAAILALLAVSACAQKTDWIEGTLVTVDVSGVWQGKADPTEACCSGVMTVNLQQRGPRVTGTFTLRRDSGAIEGTLRGDVLSLATPDRSLTAELTVTGDEMAGRGMGRQFQSRRFTLNLKRQP